MLRRSAALLALARAALAADPTCPLVFDGRVPSTAALTDFDTNNGGDWMPFNPDYIRAEALPWSETLLLPAVDPPSRFDATAETVPLEVTISDESIFNDQNGFRRAGLQFLEDSNEGSPANAGRVNVHFSIRLDAERPLNRSHEYLLVWHETAAYDANQFNFEAGTIIGQEALGGDSYKLLDRNYQVLWETPILEDEWQNFAVTVDWDADTLQMWYSEGDAELEQATEPIDNDNGGEGQYQIGMLKKPTGSDDVVNSGFQETGIDEGLIYGGIFIEDGADDCVSV